MDRNYADPRRVTRSTFDEEQAEASQRYAGESNEPRPMIAEISQRVRNASLHAQLILDRLSGVGDRLFGPQPEAGESCASGIAEQPADMDVLFIELGRLDRTLAALEHAENRIHSLA